ncbi:MAG: TIGR01620 family protein [Rhizobiaceae bacterium]
MSEAKNSTAKTRAPRAFSLDEPTEAEEPSKQGAKPSKKQKSSARKPKSFPESPKLTEIPDDAAQRMADDFQSDLEMANSLTPPPPPPAATRTAQSRFGWGRLFWVALAGLISLSLGLWIDGLITTLFARNDWLGWLAVGLVGLLGLACLALALREIWGLTRMAKIDQLRKDAADAAARDDMQAAKGLAERLTNLYSHRPDTARGRALIAQHKDQIIDGADLVKLIERDLIVALDQQARSMVMGSAKRVSVVTAVSPRALIDVGYVLWENVKLIRRIADLYGGRPGSLGFWRLTRNVVGHLAVTGTIAVGEGVVQQLVGHGVAAKLSSRLGEGVINGMLTARIGIAAIDLCRPLPFSDQTRPSVSDFMGELISLGGKSKTSPDK